jgi:hypothetical protein
MNIGVCVQYLKVINVVRGCSFMESLRRCFHDPFCVRICFSKEGMNGWHSLLLAKTGNPATDVYRCDVIISTVHFLNLCFLRMCSPWDYTIIHSFVLTISINYATLTCVYSSNNT